MSKNIAEVLKEATNGILTEEVLKEIESLFDSAVESKAKIHVEKALVDQDTDYAKKLEVLVNAIDADHVKKLNKVVEAIDRKRTAQLKMVVEKHARHIGKEAANFKSQLVTQVSDYLSAYIDEKIPTDTIEEAVKNKRAFIVLNDIRDKLGVDMALATDTIREAIKDGKDQLDKLRNEAHNVKEQLAQVTESYNIANAQLLVEKKVANLTAEKRDRVAKMLADKDSKYITENCDYVIRLVEKGEEAHLEILKEEAIKKSNAVKVDRQVVEESAKTPSTEDLGDHELTPVYMTELKKW